VITITSGFLACRARFAEELPGIDGFRYIGWARPYALAAFDLERGKALELPAIGRVLVVVEPVPDYPDTWPDPIRKGPKRQIATGDERFILYPVPDVGISAFDVARAMAEDLNPRGISVVFDGVERMLRILVETGPEWICGLEPLWDITPSDCWDQGWR
jgi:hypothetical protein